MATNLLIGYPDIPLTATAITCSETASSTYPLANLVTGSRGDRFELSAPTDYQKRINFQCATSQSGSYVFLPRADIMKEKAVSEIRLRAGAQQAFLPTSISGCLAQWNSITGITKDGSNLVSQWNDLSGNSNHLTASSTERPTWVTASSGTNGAPHLAFNGANIMRCDAVAAALTGTDVAFTAFVVVKLTNTTGNQTPFGFGRGSTTTPLHIFRATQSGSVAVLRRDDAATLVQPTFGSANTNNAVFSIVFNGTAVDVYRDGIAIGSLGSGLNVGATTLDRFSVGGRTGGGVNSEFVTGSICELILYNSALNATDRQAVEAYLATGWTTAAAYTDASFASATLYGPRQEDYFATFNAASGANWWADLFVTASSRIPTHKIYLGSLFDFGRDPQLDSLGFASEARPTDREPRHTIRLTWNDVTNAKVQSFKSLIYQYRDLSPVVLYDTNDALLNDWKVLHAEIVGGESEALATNSNRVTLELREVI